MTRLSREEFHSLARDHRIVPVWRDLLADLITPVAAFARLCGDESGFLLESVEHGERWARWSFIGRRPLATLRSRDGQVTISGEIPGEIPLDQGVMTAIEAVTDLLDSPKIDDLPPLYGGLVGFMGYDVARESLDLPNPPLDDRDLPDVVLDVIGELAAFDHFRQRVVLVANTYVDPDASDAELDAAYDAAVERLDALTAAGAEPLDEPLVEPPRKGEAPAEAVDETPTADFLAGVARIQAEIAAGEVEQVVLSQRFALELDADPFDVYRVLRQINPSPYMFFVRDPEVTLVGSSPEPLVRVSDGVVLTRPIAGTRFRGRTPADDERLATELREHPKEIEEHMQLVELAKFEIGSVARPGTCNVDELMTLERYSHVMHLTSQVSGQLDDGVSLLDVLRATVPAGTCSGAPKLRSMQLIDELEPVRRGPYAGVVGYVDFAGSLDVAIAIRTMVVAPDGRAWAQAGAGIVAGSVAEDENLECHNKARALLAAVPAARRMTAARHRR